MSLKYLSLGISPCPNDTFIFYPLLEGKIPSPIPIRPYFADVENLNQKAINHELELSKISIFTYARIANYYWLLRSGGAMGYSCGPLLLCRKNDPIPKEQIENSHILVPGLNTTATLYLRLAFPKIEKKLLIPMIFSEIMEKLSNRTGDIGLIIHESRFTFENYNLREIMDLGKWWENASKLPIPLGGIAVSRSLDKLLILELEEAISKSIEYSWKNQDECLEYCKRWAQEIDHKIMYQHIKLYVNDFSISLGEIGETAIRALFSKAKAQGIIEDLPEEIFPVN